MFISTRGLAPGNGERKMSNHVNEANYERACEALTEAAIKKFGEITDAADYWCTLKICEGWLENWLEAQGLLR